MTDPSISVVVPSRGAIGRLRPTLACLAGAVANRPTGSVEVLLVDDNDPGSADALALDHVLEEVAAWLPLHRVPGRRSGRAAARNAGADAASAPWLVFLDADTLVGPRFLEAHGEAADPAVFVHGRMRELPTAERLVTRLATASPEEIREARAGLEPGADGTRDPRRRLLANALERAIEQLDGGDLPDVAPWLGCVGANVAMARPVWLVMGGFDEAFGRVWGCEDLELGLRLHAAGVHRRLAAGALGIHLSHARPGRWEEHAENLGRFTELHPRPEVFALAGLLGPNGTPAAYVRDAQSRLVG